MTDESARTRDFDVLTMAAAISAAWRQQFASYADHELDWEVVTMKFGDRPGLALVVMPIPPAAALPENPLAQNPAQQQRSVTKAKPGSHLESRRKARGWD